MKSRYSKSGFFFFVITGHEMDKIHILSKTYQKDDSFKNLTIMVPKTRLLECGCCII